MKRIALLLSIACAVLPRLGQAQEFRPILVAAIASHERMLADLKFIGGELKDERYLDRVSALVDRLLETKGTKLDKVEGLDTSRPAGFAVLTDGVAIVPMVMLPLGGELETLMTSLKPLVGESKQEDGGTYGFGQGIRSGYAKAANGWVYFAQLTEQLVNLPDPAPWFADLVATHDLGLRLNIQNIPEVFRELAIDQLRISLESALQQKAGESDASFAFRRDIGKLQSQLIERGLGEAEQITVGASIDSAGSRGLMDVTIKPLAGSPLESHLNELNNLKTGFGNLIEYEDKPEISLVVNMTGPLDKQLIDEYTAIVNSYRDYVVELIDKSDQVKSDEERATLKELATGVTNVLSTTMEAGQLEVAARMIEKPKRTLLLAARVSEGEELKKLVDRIAELANGDPAFPNVKLNAAEVNGVAIHSLTFKPKANSPEAQLAKLFDGQFDLSVAVKENNLFLAVGAQGVDLIKQGLEPREVEVAPMEARFRINPLSRLMIQSIDQEQLRLGLSLITGTIGPADGVHVTARASDGNLRLGIETQKGAVRLAGALVGQFGTIILDMIRTQQDQNQTKQDVQSLEKEEKAEADEQAEKQQ